MITPDECPADFSILESLIARKLEEEGYSVIRGEAQEWAARYSLTKENLDGNIALFFGPSVDGDQKKYCLQARFRKNIRRKLADAGRLS